MYLYSPECPDQVVQVSDDITQREMQRTHDISETSHNKERRRQDKGFWFYMINLSAFMGLQLAHVGQLYCRSGVTSTPLILHNRYVDVDAQVKFKY